MGDMKISGGTGNRWNSTPSSQENSAGTQTKSTTQTAASTSASASSDVKSLYEMIRDAREKAEARRDSLKLKTPTRYGDAPMEAYARLGRARTRAEVNAASGYARRRIAQFQSALRNDSENAERIKAAIAQLRKAINRAGKKSKELDRERLSEIRRRKAEVKAKAEKSKAREAQRLRQELQRQRSLRKIRESGYLRETEVENRTQDQLAATRLELRAQAQALGASTSISPEVAAQQYAQVSMSDPSIGTGMDSGTAGTTEAVVDGGIDVQA